MAKPTLIALALGALAVAARAQCPDGTPPPCRSAVRPAAPAGSGSIAVLPFSNRSPDSSDAYLADALPEQIVGRLATVPGLMVKSATAVEAQWRRTPEPMAAARALRVEWFVSGSIRRAGRQVTVNAELVRAASGDGAWAAPFRRGDGDVGTIEEQIAESVAVGVVGRLAPADAALLRRPKSRDVEAYQRYLLGRTLVKRRTTADIAGALAAFTFTVQRDSTFAPGWAWLGFARALQIQWGPFDTPPDTAAAWAERAIDRALRLDSSLADAWAARGIFLTITRGNLGDAHSALERALQLDSLRAETWHAMAYLYSSDRLLVPELEERYELRALQLDPDARNSWRYLSQSYFLRGQYVLAQAFIDSALARGTWGFGLAMRASIRAARGDGAGALADLDGALRAGGLPSGTIATAGELRDQYQFLSGDSSAGRARLDTLRALRASGQPYSAQSLATWSMLFGDRGTVLDVLEDALRRTNPAAEPACGPLPCSRSLGLWTVLNALLFAPLRDDPRYQRLLAETRPHIPWLPGW